MKKLFLTGQKIAILSDSSEPIIRDALTSLTVNDGSTNSGSGLKDWKDCGRVDLENIVMQARSRVAIVANGGFGKSTNLKHLESRIAKSNKFLPIIMRLDEINNCWNSHAWHVIPKGALDQDPDQQCHGKAQPGDQEKNKGRGHLPRWAIRAHAGGREAAACGGNTMGSQTVSGHEQVRIPKTNLGGNQPRIQSDRYYSGIPLIELTKTNVRNLTDATRKTQPSNQETNKDVGNSPMSSQHSCWWLRHAAGTR